MPKTIAPDRRRCSSSRAGGEKRPHTGRVANALFPRLYQRFPLPQYIGRRLGPHFSKRQMPRGELTRISENLDLDYPL